MRSPITHALAVAMIALAVAAASLGERPKAEPLPQALPSEVAIYSSWILETETGWGTAVSLWSNDTYTYFLTAKHNSDPLELSQGEETVDVVSYQEHPTADVMLLRTERVNIVPSKLGHVPTPGQPLISCGYQAGSHMMATSGFAGDEPGMSSTPIIMGCSGGPMLNLQGELVGVISMVGRMSNGEKEIFIFHICYYVPIDDIRGWLAVNAPGP